MLTFRDLKDGYERNWANLQIRPQRADEAAKEAKRMLKGKTTYQQIEAKTNAPWHFVALCHYRESHFDFDTYLGNGQSLGRVTTIVPKGRGPFTGPNAFVDGAVDRDTGNRDPRGHLHGGEQRVEPAEALAEDRHPDHRQIRVGGRDPGQGRRHPGSGRRHPGRLADLLSRLRDRVR